MLCKLGAWVRSIRYVFFTMEIYLFVEWLLDTAL